MADGEDAAVHAVQPPDPDAVVDRAPAQAGAGELTPADDAVLPRREHSDSEIRTGLVGLFIHQMNKLTRWRSSPPSPRPRRAAGRFVHAPHEQTDQATAMRHGGAAVMGA